MPSNWYLLEPQNPFIVAETTIYLTVSHSYWLVFLQGVQFQSRYLTEELQRIFTEDTDSEMETFEGFDSSEVDVNKEGVPVRQLHTCEYMC